MARQKKGQAEGDKEKSGIDMGMADTEILKAVDELTAIKEEADSRNGKYRNRIKQFEEDGGHRKALLDAVKLSKQSDIKMQDYVRSFVHYCKVLGLDEQGDLFGSVADQEQIDFNPEKAEAAAEAQVH